MADDGEDVVFANSALYQHLQDAGFSDDVEIEHHASNIENIVDGDEQADIAGELSSPISDEDPSPMHMMPGNWWQKESKRVEQECGLRYSKDVLTSGVLEEDDAIFLHNYSQLFDTPNSLIQTTSIFSSAAFKVSMGVLGVLSAYAVHRWTDSTILPVMAQTIPLWMFDIGVVTLGVISFIPLTSSLVSYLLLRRHMDDLLKNLSQLLHQLKEARAACRKVIRFIQEMELVTRGFTLVTTQIPISRLEQSAQRSDRQCPELRRLLFHSCRELVMQTRTTMKLLLERCPLVDEGGTYLSCIPLSDYGPSMTIQKEESLCEATDNYSIAAIKSIFQVYCLHISELLRRLVMGCILHNKDHRSILKESHIAIGEFNSLLAHHTERLSQSLLLHECTFLEPTKEESARPTDKCQTHASSVFIALHSLSLHLQAALKRVKELEKTIESQTANSEGSLDTQLSAMTSDLKVIKADLDSCHDCWDETVSRLEKKQPQNNDKGVDPTDWVPSDTGTNEKEPVPLFEMGDPVIQDQVFEAYTDPCEVDTADYDDSDSLFSKKDKERSRMEREEALRLLKELKTVIAVRGKNWDEREERARRAMAGQPDVIDDIANDHIEIDDTSETQPASHASRVDAASQSNHVNGLVTEDLSAASQDNDTQVSQQTVDGDPRVNCQPGLDIVSPVAPQDNVLPQPAAGTFHGFQPHFPHLTHTKEDICTISPHIAALTKLCAGIDADQDNGIVPETSDCTCIVTTTSNGLSHDFIHSDQCRTRIKDLSPQIETENFIAIGDGGEFFPPSLGSSEEDHLASLKMKLEEACGLPLGMSSSVAALAAARSQSFGLKCDTIEDIFGDSDSDSDEFLES